MKEIMDINSLIIFHKIAETNNFSKASIILDIPISTISRKISKLEDDLKQKLFIRNTRKIHLTAEGQALYDKSKKIFDELYNLTNTFEEECNTVGDIRITATLEYKHYLAPKIVQFRKLFPHINLFINFSNDMKDLIEDSYDFAFRAGNLKDSSLYSFKLHNDQLNAYVFDKFYKRALDTDTNSEILIDDFDYCMLQNNTILTTKNGQQIKPKNKIVSNSIEFILEYAKEQPSIIYIPESFSQNGFIKLENYESKISYFHIVYLHKQLNKPSRLFLDFFKTFQQV